MKTIKKKENFTIPLGRSEKHAKLEMLWVKPGSFIMGSP